MTPILRGKLSLIKLLGPLRGVDHIWVSRGQNRFRLLFDKVRACFLLAIVRNPPVARVVRASLYLGFRGLYGNSLRILSEVLRLNLEPLLS